MQEREYETLAEATVFGFGSGIGWMLAIVGHCSHTGKDAIQQCAGSFEGTGNYIHSYRTDGNCIYGISGN